MQYCGIFPDIFIAQYLGWIGEDWLQTFMPGTFQSDDPHVDIETLGLGSHNCRCLVNDRMKRDICL